MVIRFGKITKAVDIPDDRKIHKSPTPRVGGVGIFVSILISLIMSKLIYVIFLVKVLPAKNAVVLENVINQKWGAVIVGAILIFILGIIDDYKNLRAILKLILQIVIATIIFLMGVKIEGIGIVDFDLHTNTGFILSLLITLIWLVGMFNIINLIDGLDGLAGGITVIATLSIAYASYNHGHYVNTLVMLITAGATLGFLPKNFHPAKIFMGDGGAYLLGFMLGVGAIILPAKKATLISSIVPVVIVLSIPIIDTITAIIRRSQNKSSIFKPDKKHIHHRIMNIGLGYRKSVLMLYSIAVCFGIAAITFSRGHIVEFVVLTITAFVLMLILIVSGKNSGGK